MPLRKKLKNRGSQRAGVPREAIRGSIAPGELLDLLKTFGGDHLYHFPIGQLLLAQASLSRNPPVEVIGQPQSL